MAASLALVALGLLVHHYYRCPHCRRPFGLKYGYRERGDTLFVERRCRSCRVVEVCMVGEGGETQWRRQ